MHTVARAVIAIPVAVSAAGTIPRIHQTASTATAAAAMHTAVRVAAVMPAAVAAELSVLRNCCHHQTRQVALAAAAVAANTDWQTRSTVAAVAIDADIADVTADATAADTTAAALAVALAAACITLT